MIHDLRSPLGAIHLWSQLLKKGPMEPQDEARAIDAISNSSVRLGKIIDEILDVRRLATAGDGITLRSVPVAPIVSAVSEAAEPLANAKRVTLQTILEPGPLTVQGDAPRLQRALTILVFSAVDLCTKHGTVVLQLSRVGHDASIEVRDATPRVPSSLAERDFLGSEPVRIHPGSLEVARHLIEAQGGELGYGGSREGAGSVFQLRLPLAGGTQFARRDLEGHHAQGKEPP
jgi:two-component system sensor histidine kinase SenX3